MFMSTQLVGAFLFHSVCSLLSTVADTFTRLWITRPLAGPTKVTSVYPGYVVVTDITIGYESRYSGHVDPAVGALLMTFETAHTWLPGVCDTKSRTEGGVGKGNKRWKSSLWRQWLGQRKQMFVSLLTDPYLNHERFALWDHNCLSVCVVMLTCKLLFQHSPNEPASLILFHTYTGQKHPLTNIKWRISFNIAI